MNVINFSRFKPYFCVIFEFTRDLFCFQSVATAISFFYASALGLQVQLGILFATATFGTLTFVMTEWQAKKEAARKNAETLNNSDNSSDTTKSES